MILLGIGAGMAFNPVLLAAMGDVEPQDAGPRVGRRQHGVHDGRRARARGAGLARGVSGRTRSLASGEGELEALTGGYHVAFLVGAIFAAGAAAIGGLLLRPKAMPAMDMHGGEGRRRRCAKGEPVSRGRVADAWLELLVEHELVGICTLVRRPAPSGGLMLSSISWTRRASSALSVNVRSSVVPPRGRRAT